MAKKSLHILLQKLCQNPAASAGSGFCTAIRRRFIGELIQTMKNEPKICHYLDLPIQHANNQILKRMGRRTSKEDLVQIIRTLREEIPDIVLRTTLITGFPGRDRGTASGADGLCG